MCIASLPYRDPPGQRPLVNRITDRCRNLWFTALCGYLHSHFLMQCIKNSCNKCCIVKTRIKRIQSINQSGVKHYLPATSFAGGKYGSALSINCFDHVAILIRTIFTPFPCKSDKYNEWVQGRKKIKHDKYANKQLAPCQPCKEVGHDNYLVPCPFIHCIRNWII